MYVSCFGLARGEGCGAVLLTQGEESSWQGSGVMLCASTTNQETCCFRAIQSCINTIHIYIFVVYRYIDDMLYTTMKFKDDI